MVTTAKRAGALVSAQVTEPKTVPIVDSGFFVVPCPNAAVEMVRRIELHINLRLRMHCLST